MDENCIFCKIAKGEIPCYKIYEDEEFISFLDIFPSVRGQVLVIPKKHSESYFFNLNDEEYSKILLVAKKIVKAIDKSLKPYKTGMIVEGLELDHLHIKLYPLEKNDTYFNKILCRPLEPKPTEEEMKKIAEKIRDAL